MKRRTLIVIAVAAALAAVAVVYAMFDPSSTPFPRCPFLSLTGLKCPGCGSQRAIHALLNGDIAAALRFNPMLFAAVPAVAVYLYAESPRMRSSRLSRALCSSGAAYTLLAIITLWWIGRNIV